MTQSEVMARFDRGLISADDSELIERVRQHDGEALGELYRRHAPAALRAARALTGSAHDADDVVSEVFSAVWRAIRNGRGPTDRFEPYLIAAVRNRARQLWFNGSHHTGLDEQVEASMRTEVFPAEPEPDLAAHAFVALNPREQEMLWLTAVEGRSSVEAGEEMSLTRRAAATLKFRAKQSFAQAYLSQYAAAAGRRQSCRTLSPKLSSYVRGSCRQRARMEVERHLAVCSSCSSLVEALADVNTTFRSAGLPIAAGVVATGATRLSWIRRFLASLRRLSFLKAAIYVTAGGLVTVLPAAALFGTDRDVPEPDALVIDEDARVRPERDEPEKQVRRILAGDFEADEPAAASSDWTRPRVAVPDGEVATPDKAADIEGALMAIAAAAPSMIAPSTTDAPTLTTAVAASPEPEAAAEAPAARAEPDITVAAPPESTAPTTSPPLTVIGLEFASPIELLLKVTVAESAVAADVGAAVDKLSAEAEAEVAVDEPSVDVSLAGTVPIPGGEIAADAAVVVDPGSVTVDVSATVPPITVGDVELVPEIPIDLALELPILDLLVPPTTLPAAEPATEPAAEPVVDPAAETAPAG